MTTFKRLTLLVSFLLLLVPASSASAAAPAPGWTIESSALPTSFSAADTAACLKNVDGQISACDSYLVRARNAGGAATQGAVTVEDKLPEGLTIENVKFFSPAIARALGVAETEDLFPLLQVSGFCSTTPVRCSSAVGGSELPVSVKPDEELRLVTRLTVSEPGPRSLQGEAVVSGGGAASASVQSANHVGSPPAFGFSKFGFYVAGVDGTRDTQAADHPYELAVTFNLNSAIGTGPQSQAPAPNGIEDPRDIVTDLPVGFVGSILAAPRCTFAQLSSHIYAVGGCPANTIIGHILTEPVSASSINAPIYNMTPEKGFPAEFAYLDVLGAPHSFYSRVVPTPRGYVLQTTNPDIPQLSLTNIVVTFFGDPGEHFDREYPVCTFTGGESRYKDSRCTQENSEHKGAYELEPGGAPRIPFFTNPTDCAGEEPTVTTYMDSWQHPAKFNPDGTPVNLEESAWAKAESKSPAVTGCNALQFTPELQSTPTTKEADTPSGMEVAIKVPQFETPGVPASPTLKDASVMFPEGFTLDPAAGDGLEACSEAQIGWLGADGPHGEPLPNRGLTNFSPAPPQCPEASKVGSLELTTPLINGTLHGEMYLATQNENPYGSEIGLYVVVHDPVTGVLVKIAGRTLSNPQTGQITGVFEENPNLPFDELKLSFFGGPRAEFATPNGCGTFTTASDLTPWSAPDSGPDALPLSSFPIDTACVSGFGPAFTGSNLNLQAGAYSPFVASFSREDTDHELGGLSVSLPPGLLADVGSVPLCGDAQANAGTCPESTQVGTVLAEAGPGPNPLPDRGKVYLTGPYNGGPYGLSVVVPAVAGPFNFGLVVVRQSLRVDPTNAHVTDVSDAFPTMLHATGAGGETIGIPIRLRRVEVAINRPGFAFNPTNCSKMQVGGSITSTQGESKALETPFQVTNCASLKFTPKFQVSTTPAKDTRIDGATLTAKLTEPSEPQGAQANIARVKVELPKALPSRLTTLRKACTDAQFEANPAECPSASRIGYATVHTPILAGALTGPAIFVSHGGEAFPSLTMVLQGDGVTIDLVGTTFISKAGVTSTTFKTVPDTPFSSFELTLPQGEYSALTALGNLCAQQSTMPTEFVAQNGAEIHESTKVGVTGCTKKVRRERKKKHRRRKMRKK